MKIIKDKILEKNKQYKNIHFVRCYNDGARLTKCIWKTGMWKRGLFKRGTWLNGVWDWGWFKFSTWEDGHWKNGFREDKEKKGFLK